MVDVVDVDGDVIRRAVLPVESCSVENDDDDENPWLEIIHVVVKVKKKYILLVVVLLMIIIMFAVLIYWSLVNAVANVIQGSLVTVLLLFKNCKDYKNLYTDVTYLYTCWVFVRTECNRHWKKTIIRTQSPNKRWSEWVVHYSKGRYN